MAAWGVGDLKTRSVTDLPSHGHSPSSMKDRHSQAPSPSANRPPPQLVSPAKPFSFIDPKIFPEQSSSREPAKQNVTVFRETAPGDHAAVSRSHQLASGGGSENGSSRESLSTNSAQFAEQQPVTFHGSDTEKSEFAFPRAVQGEFEFRHPCLSAASMVALSASHRPVLHKSHSVAFGVDSTVPPPTPPPTTHTSETNMLHGAAEHVQAPGNLENPEHGDCAEIMELSGNQPSLSPASFSSSSISDVKPSEMSHSFVAPRAVCSRRGSLGHQDSFGFVIPSASSDPQKQPLQRSESLTFDGLAARNTAFETSEMASRSLPYGSRRREGWPQQSHEDASQGLGKWRSSAAARRSVLRKKPLSRSSSRNALASPSATAPQTQLQTEDGTNPGSSSSAGNALVVDQHVNPEVLSKDEDMFSGVAAEDQDMSDVFVEDHMQSDILAKDGNTHSNFLAEDKNVSSHVPMDNEDSAEADNPNIPQNVAQAMPQTIPQAAPQTFPPNVPQAVHQISIPTSPQSFPRPIHRQQNRRRSHRQSGSTSIPSTPTPGEDADDEEEKREERDDDERRGVTVEDALEGKGEGEDSPTFTPPASPRPAKSRRVDMSNFDPYQVFEVQHLPCIILTVQVIRGRNITNGWAQDLVDTPDPYVKLRIKTAPEGRQRTKTVANNANPVWNETFTFFLGFSEVNILELVLMEENPLLDQETGTVYFNIHDRITEFGKWQTEIFNFNGVSEIDVAFHMEWDQNPTLRYSLCLSDPEKEFMRKRKQKVWQALNAFLGEQGPKTVEETPTIAVIGSGGGFRAMTGYSGVFKALADTGLLDCATYACGLSGSSWYLSTLYSHDRWPEMNPGEMQSELMSNIDKSLVRLLGPQSVYRYIRSVVGKRRQGQPVSFTDFFGHMVGETLLKGRQDRTRLTDQRKKIQDANVPMPLYTCVHVKKDVPARSFQEWVEFSPYEIGMPKYGTFMDSKFFGSKFFMGKLVKQYEEPPLHFLQGIWGSAFCILFKRLLEDNRNLDPTEMIRREMELRHDLGEHLEEQQEKDNDSSDISEDDDDEEDETDDTDDEARNGTSRRRSSAMFVPASFKKASSPGTDSSDRDTSDGEVDLDLQPPQCFLTRQDSSEGFDDVDSRPVSSSNGDARSHFDSDSSNNIDIPSPRPIRRTSSPGGEKSGVLSCSPDCPKKGVTFSCQVDRLEERKASKQQQQHRKTDRRPALKRAPTIRRGRSRSYWNSMLQGIFESRNLKFLSTRAGRAAVIHNFMRGLNLQQTYPLSPFTPISQRVREGDEFDGIFDLHPTHIKHIYMVDAGLTFNSPFPLVLRPQRAVDVILSFDFSARGSDSTPPFKELLLAEKWAKLNRLPFPPVDPTVVDREGLKELYVFQNPDDPYCPVVLHFPLINIHFRDFKAPGVPRKTQEEKDFADFDIFDDPKVPFSTFNFVYSNQNFQRLSKLTEFNTLLSLEHIKKVLAQVVARKRQASPRRPLQDQDFKLLRMKSVQEKRELKKFLRKMESRNSAARTPTPTNSQPTTPFFTPTPVDSVRERNPFVFNYKSTSSSSSSGSSQEGKNPFFNMVRQSSQTRTRKGSNSSPRSPRSPRKRQSNAGVKRQVSDASSNEFVSTSSVPCSPPCCPLPSVSGDYEDVFHQALATPTSTSPSPSTQLPSISPVQHHVSSSEAGNLRDNSMGTLQQGPRVSVCSFDEEFHDAAEAFTGDGEAVTDPHLAKMYYEGAKQRRKMFRRQSTISTLNSSTQSISLDAENPPSRPSRSSQASSTGSVNIDIADLEQFKGIEDENDEEDDHMDAADEHWFDSNKNDHRGSVVTLADQGGS